MVSKMNVISERPLILISDVGETSAIVSFVPSEIEIDRVFGAAVRTVSTKSSEAICLKAIDLDKGLMKLETNPLLKSEISLKEAAELVAKELARTCINSPLFDETLYQVCG